MRGEHSFEADGKSWTLRFGNTQFCAVEEEFDAPWAQVAAGLDGDGFRFTTFRSVFRIGLSTHHPNLSTKDVSDLLDEIGMVEAGRMLGGCIRAAMPAPKASDSGEEPAAA